MQYCSDIRVAGKRIVEEAYSKWLANEERTDDISIIVIDCSLGATTSDENETMNTTAAVANLSEIQLDVGTSLPNVTGRKQAKGRMSLAIPSN